MFPVHLHYLNCLVIALVLKSTKGTVELQYCAYGSLEKDYRGTLNVTGDGKTCQRWDSQTPHGHGATVQNYPNSGLEENYCRNPDNTGGGVWCYTTDPAVRWRYCDIPSCSEFFADFTCGPLPNVSNSQLSDVTYTWNSIANYTCETGSGHTGGDLLRVCTIDKSWNGTSPTCALYAHVILGELENVARMYDQLDDTCAAHPITDGGISSVCSPFPVKLLLKLQLGVRKQLSVKYKGGSCAVDEILAYVNYDENRPPTCGPTHIEASSWQTQICSLISQDVGSTAESLTTCLYECKDGADNVYVALSANLSYLQMCEITNP